MVMVRDGEAEGEGYMCVLTSTAWGTHRGALVPSVQVHQARVNVWLQHCSGCGIVLIGAVVGDDEEELHANEHVVLQPLHQVADVGGGVQPASSMNQHRRWDRHHKSSAR